MTSAPGSEVNPVWHPDGTTLFFAGGPGGQHVIRKSLTTALKKCSDEKFVAGVICEQKARLRYCEGKWGQVPQCTAKPHVD